MTPRAGPRTSKDFQPTPRRVGHDANRPARVDADGMEYASYSSHKDRLGTDFTDCTNTTQRGVYCGSAGHLARHDGVERLNAQARFVQLLIFRFELHPRSPRVLAPVWMQDREILSHERRPDSLQSSQFGPFTLMLSS